MGVVWKALLVCGGPGGDCNVCLVGGDGMVLAVMLWCDGVVVGMDAVLVCV